MAEECTESSVATSSSTPNWWHDHIHPNSMFSWSTNTTNHWHLVNPNSNSSCEDDVSISTSFTNASNHSGLSVDSPRQFVESAPANELIGETGSDNHLWSHVLWGVGGRVESTRMFEPAFDYLKKMDNSWEFTNSPSFNTFNEKHYYNGFHDNLIESERLTKLSNLVSNWSIAPPHPEVNNQFDPQGCNISLSSTIDECSLSNIKKSLLCYGNDMKMESEIRGYEPNGALFQRTLGSTNGFGHHMTVNNSSAVDNRIYSHGIQDMPSTTARSYDDLLSHSSYLSKPLVDINASKPFLKPCNLSDSRKQALQTSPGPTISTRQNGRGQSITSEGKKKRSEENSEAVLKKPKHESSTASSVKVPKIKLADKITALQQIVAPFGKTDTASVLWEAIGCIKFLQEQVQLLSNPYMKINASKDLWGNFDRKDRGDAKFDLKTRGLCLVPISCTPQVYRENTGSDYWTPPYRGCLYR